MSLFCSDLPVIIAEVCHQLAEGGEGVDVPLMGARDGGRIRPLPEGGLRALGDVRTERFA
jgi:hypothetical protein